MNSPVCATVYFVEGTHKADFIIPMNLFIRSPFQAPMMFGKVPETGNSARVVGVPEVDSILGTFINQQGDFLSLEHGMFAVFTPKARVTLSQTMFPHHSTDALVLSGKSSIHRIERGSVIVCIRQRTLHTFSIFMDGSDFQHERLQLAYVQSMNYLVKTFRSMRLPTGVIDVSIFDTLEAPPVSQVLDEGPAAKRAKTGAK